MKGKGYITMFCLVFVLVINGQNKAYTNTDFYGAWILDIGDGSLNDDEYIFKRQKTTKSRKEEFNITISLIDTGECIVNYDTIIYCGGNTNKDYSWTFNKELGIINIYHSEKWLKEFKELHPEDFKSSGFPERHDEMELAILPLENGTIGLEITSWE